MRKKYYIIPITILTLIILSVLLEFKNIDEIYVINLDRSQDRWIKVSKQLDEANIKYRRFNAIDGYKVILTDLLSNTKLLGLDIKNNSRLMKYKSMYKVTCNPEAMNPTEFNYLHTRELSLSAGEFGIWCSNIMIWHDIIKNNYRKAVIFEDDIIIKSPNFKQDLNNFVANLPSDVDLAYLDIQLYQGSAHKLFNNEYVSRVSHDAGGWGAWAVAYSNKGIKKLLSFKCYSHALDNFIWSIMESSRYTKPECSGNSVNLSIYASSKDLLDVPSHGSEICKMGRNYWQC